MSRWRVRIETDDPFDVYENVVEAAAPLAALSAASLRWAHERGTGPQTGPAGEAMRVEVARLDDGGAAAS